MKSSIAKRQLEDTENIQQFEPVQKRSRTDKGENNTAPGEFLLHRPMEQVNTNMCYDVKTFRNLNQKRYKLEIQQKLIRGIIEPKTRPPTSQLMSLNVSRKVDSPRGKQPIP